MQGHSNKKEKMNKIFLYDNIPFIQNVDRDLLHSQPNTARLGNVHQLLN